MPRILVIDDSPSALEAVATMLVGAGYEVCACGSGKRAQQMVVHGAFDLILTDIFMPEEDGLEVIRKARQLRPFLPIVAMSGVSGTLDMLPVAKQLGARQLLRKPFSNADLLAVVESALAAPPRRSVGAEQKTRPFGKAQHNL